MRLESGVVQMGGVRGIIPYGAVVVVCATATVLAAALGNKWAPRSRLEYPRGSRLRLG